MQKTLRKALLHSVTVLVLCMLCLAMALGGLLTSPVVYADTVIGDVQMDCSDVMEDLESSTIDGKPFDISDYAFDESEQTQVVMFAEYCYSFYANRQDNYGLYVYVWNPQGLRFALDSTRNKISLRTGKDESVGYTKYTLLYLDQCDQTNYEGLFLKFKVLLSGEEKEKILESLKSDERVYSVGEIELLTEGAANATASAVSTVYTFSGFAKGYGSDVDAASTLTCTQEQNEVLTLDVKSTYYRPEGSNGSENKQDTLHSVYFSVPNDILEEYGEMTAVHATWLNAYTTPIFVTGNEELYEGFYELVAKESPETDYAFHTNESGRYIGGFYFADYSHGYNYTASVDSVLTQLNYVFFAGSGTGSADDYTLSAEEILAWLSAYTEEYGGELVNDKYSSALFEQVDDEFTDLTIRRDDTFSLTSVTTSQTLWQKIWGTSTSYTNTYTMSAIQEVSLSAMDNASSVSAFCDAYYVAESDYDDLYDYVEAAESNDETVFLFRYYQSEYFSAELSEGMWETGWYFETVGGISTPVYGRHYVREDTNAYLAQMWVQLDFDVIDVTFTNGGADVVIPVVSSPIDAVADATPPLITTEDSLPWWAYAAAGLAAVVVLLALRLLLVTICGLPSWVFLLIVVAVLFTAVWWFDPFATWLYGILSKWLL